MTLQSHWDSTLPRMLPQRTLCPDATKAARYSSCTAFIGNGTMMLMFLPSMSRLLNPNMVSASELALSITPRLVNDCATVIMARSSRDASKEVPC